MTGKRRAAKRTGHDSYDAYFEALKAKAAVAGVVQATTKLPVFIAACVGSKNLSAAVGRPLCAIGSAADPAAAVARFSQHRHGGGVLENAHMAVEPGWDSWRLLSLSNDMVKGAPLAPGLRFDRGRLLVDIVSPCVPALFKRRLAMLLHSRRFDEALTTEASVRWRYDRNLALPVPARYGATDAKDPATWARVHDLYVFDPWRDLGRLAALIGAAANAHDI